MNNPNTLSVLFVCVRNSGKSQMAAGLMRDLVGKKVAVHSAGTEPGTGLNDLSVQALLDVGVDISGEEPKPIDPQLMHSVDLIVTLWTRNPYRTHRRCRGGNWDTVEPSGRGIDGIERMELIRNDIAARVAELAKRLLDTPAPEGRHPTDIGSHP